MGLSFQDFLDEICNDHGFVRSCSSRPESRGDTQKSKSVLKRAGGESKVSQNGLKQPLKCEKTPSLHYSQSPGFLKGRIKYYLYPLLDQRRGFLDIE